MSASISTTRVAVEDLVLAVEREPREWPLPEVERSSVGLRIQWTVHPAGPEGALAR
jgi:hypothetical protein